MSDLEKQKNEINENAEKEILILKNEKEKLELKINEGTLAKLSVADIVEIHKDVNEIERKIEKIKDDSNEKIKEIEATEQKIKEPFFRVINIKNPLQMIALFVSILELAVLYALPQLMNTNSTLLSAANLTAYINFTIWFPVLVVLAFFITLHTNPLSLYGPSDFGENIKEYLAALLDPVKKEIQPLNEKINKQDETVNNVKLASTLLLKGITAPPPLERSGPDLTREMIEKNTDDNLIVTEVLNLLK